MSNAYQQVIDAGRRLKILQTLEQCGGYSIHVDQLYEFLNQQRYIVAHDELIGNLKWLAAQKLIEVEQVSGLHLVTLTQRGLDVQAGRSRVAGVARLRPGD